MPVMKVAPAERERPAVFDVEALARPVDDAWADDSRNPAGGQDVEADETSSADDAEQSEDPRRIDFFA